MTGGPSLEDERQNCAFIRALMSHGQTDPKAIEFAEVISTATPETLRKWSSKIDHIIKIKELLADVKPKRSRRKSRAISGNVVAGPWNDAG